MRRWYKYAGQFPNWALSPTYSVWAPFKMLLILAISLLLVHRTTGNPTKGWKSCQDYTLPISTTTINFIWGLPELQTNFDAATFNTDLGRWDANTTLNPISGGAQATAAYQISGTFCAPTKGGNGVVLLATHGFGFDRRHLFHTPALEIY